MWDLKETIDQLAKADSVHWNGHVLKKDKNSILRRALYFKVKGTRKNGRPKKTRLWAAAEQSGNVGLNESDANNRSRWTFGVNAIHSKMMYIRPPPLLADKTGF